MQSNTKPQSFQKSQKPEPKHMAPTPTPQAPASLPKSTRPMRVYTVREFTRAGSQEPEQSWTPIGVCFPNKKDEGFSIRLDAFPIDGRLVVRPPKDDAADDADSDGGDDE